MADIPILTIPQPHCSVVANRLQDYVILRQPMKYRGKVALFAPTISPQRELNRLPRATRARIRNWMYEDMDELPLGAIIATADLVDCLTGSRMHELLPAADILRSEYYRGRFAYRFKNVQRLPEPIYEDVSLGF